MDRHQRIIAIALAMAVLFTQTIAKADTIIKLNGIGKEILSDFLQQHPGISITNEPYKFYGSTGEMVSDLLLDSFEHDVFTLLSSCVDYQTIINKGYCLNLSSSEKIREAVQKLHPVFAKQCVYDGGIYAVPYHIQLNYMVMSPEVLAKTDIGDVAFPTSFPEFLDFVEQWIAYLKENPECNVALLGMAYWGDQSFYTSQSYTDFLVEQLLDNHIMQKEFAGEPLRFDESELIELLKRCYRIGKELYIYDQGVQCLDSILLNGPSTMTKNSYLFLPMRINSDQPMLIPVYVKLYAVSAKTENPQLCIELMETLLDRLSPEDGAYLYQNAEPVLREDYDEQLARGRQLIQDTLNQLSEEDLDLANRDELEARLERQQAILKNMLENEEKKYSVTATELDRYHRHVDDLYVQMPGVFHSGDVEEAKNFKQLKARFAGGQLSAGQLVKELDRLARMIEMEGK